MTPNISGVSTASDMHLSFPLVSFITPTYNAAHFLSEAVDSALAQTYPNIEVIIVDDGSTDDTEAMIQARYGGDARVRYFRQANQGPAAARNRAIAEARGVYVHLLDSDERLFPEKVERSYALFQQYPEAAVVYGYGIAVQPDGQTIIPMERPKLPSGDVFCEWLYGTMSGGTHSVTGSFMLKREAVLAVGGFDEKFWASEDWDLWLRLSARYPFIALDDDLVYYRRMPDGLHKQRFNIVHGRLWAVQKVRLLNAEKRCLTDVQFNRLEAGRWHMLAMYYWGQGQRREARTAFNEAARIDRSKAKARRLYGLLTYCLPTWSIEYLGSLRSRVKRLRG